MMDEKPEWPQHNAGAVSQFEIKAIQAAANRIESEIGKVIVGQMQTLELLLCALFSGGHVLIEGVPGIAKTLMARLLAKTISTRFSRIQFTPDLMPADVVGTTVFNFKTSEFNFNRGPVFSNIVLIDEINRAPAKTQAALFEVMEENQVTVDGHSYPMDFPFLVVATQNPVEQEGTYRLPEAQLDRFAFRIQMPYPTLEEESLLLLRFKEDFLMKQAEQVSEVVTAGEIKQIRQGIEKITIADELVNYIAGVVVKTRQHGDLFLGASPRASLAILKNSKAMAALHGRDFVTPDDIRRICYPVLNHRIVLTAEREMEGKNAQTVIEEILEKQEVPR